MANKSPKMVIEGTLYWAQIRKPDQFSGKYQINIIPDEKYVKELEKAGVPFSEKDSVPGPFITAKSNFPVTVVDTERRLIPENVLVGNGSTARVKITPYAYNFKGKEGVTALLDGIIILSLSVFKKDGQDDEFTPIDAAPKEGDDGDIDISEVLL